MTTYERRKKVVEILENQPGIRVQDIAEIFHVSQGTVRNDLNALESEGFLTRVHGGAVLNQIQQKQNITFQTRKQTRTKEKKCIGSLAANLVHDGDSILLDASTTAYYLAMNLADRTGLRVITNGFEVSLYLAQNPTNTVMMIGGVVSQDTSSVTGLLSERIIAELSIEKAFVSCTGFTFERGLTEDRLQEAQIKRKGIESAKQVIALVDSSKIGRDGLSTFALPDQISQLFTDLNLTNEWRENLSRENIPFTLCGE